MSIQFRGSARAAKIILSTALCAAFSTPGCSLLSSPIEPTVKDPLPSPPIPLLHLNRFPKPTQGMTWEYLYSRGGEKWTLVYQVQFMDESSIRLATYFGSLRGVLYAENGCSFDACKSSLKEVGNEDITVPAGTFSRALKLGGAGKLDSNGEVVWVSPQVGVVKQQFDDYGQTVTAELVSFGKR